MSPRNFEKMSPGDPKQFLRLRDPLNFSEPQGTLVSPRFPKISRNFKRLPGTCPKDFHSHYSPSVISVLSYIGAFYSESPLSYLGFNQLAIWNSLGVLRVGQSINQKYFSKSISTCVASVSTFSKCL